MPAFVPFSISCHYSAVAWVQDENDGTYGTPFTAIIGAESTLDRDAERAATLNGDVVRILVRGHVVGHADLIAAAGTVMPGGECKTCRELHYSNRLRLRYTSSEAN
jgi:hypothetical protein